MCVMLLLWCAQGFSADDEHSAMHVVCGPGWRLLGARRQHSRFPQPAARITAVRVTQPPPVCGPQLPGEAAAAEHEVQLALRELVAGAGSWLTALCIDAQLSGPLPPPDQLPHLQHLAVPDVRGPALWSSIQLLLAGGLQKSLRVTTAADSSAGAGGHWRALFPLAAQGQIAATLTSLSVPAELGDGDVCARVSRGAPALRELEADSLAGPVPQAVRLLRVRKDVPLEIVTAWVMAVPPHQQLTLQATEDGVEVEMDCALDDNVDMVRAWIVRAVCMAVSVLRCRQARTCIAAT